MLQKNKNKYKLTIILFPLIALPLGTFFALTVFDTDFNIIERIMMAFLGIAGLLCGSVFPMYNISMYNRINSISTKDAEKLEDYVNTLTQERMDKLENRINDNIWMYLYEYLSSIRSSAIDLLEGKSKTDNFFDIDNQIGLENLENTAIQKNISEAKSINGIVHKYYDNDNKWKKGQKEDKFSSVYRNIMIIVMYVVIISIFVSLIILIPQDIQNILSFIFVIAIWLIIIVYLLKNKNRKNKINKKEYDLIKKYTNNNRILETLDNYKIENIYDYYTIYDGFELFDSIRRSFISAESDLGISKEEAIDMKLLNLIKKINNKDLEGIYEKERKMIEIIFKYYDNNGKWRGK